MKHIELRFFGYTTALVLGVALGGGAAFADDAAGPATASTAPATAPATATKHQLMKDCMRKQKAAISGRSDYELAADCKDIIKTEKQNADTEKKVDDKGG